MIRHHEVIPCFIANEKPPVEVIDAAVKPETIGRKLTIEILFKGVDDKLLYRRTAGTLRYLASELETGYITKNNTSQDGLGHQAEESFAYDGCVNEDLFITGNIKHDYIYDTSHEFPTGSEIQQRVDDYEQKIKELFLVPSNLLGGPTMETRAAYENNMINSSVIERLTGSSDYFNKK